ncbi:MAG TPA: sigma-70 family RNA polymerase sigma factor [Frankiaceae bacterium]|jgi:RNA polymerase sigma factor (sigma-70 family)|nr:sigma-70 family RNA polymerase sigma factor [Frankiaceae bacterium]
MAVPWPEIAAHRERLVRVARRRVPTREDAEDVASEAMLRCATFEDLDPARLAQFLTAVTLRLCADVYRDAEKGTRLVRRLDLDDEPSPEDLACAAADAGMLRDLLRRLPDNQRAVLVDRADGLSVTQISHRRALTYKAVESALSRARSTMRNALAGALALVFAAAEALRRRPAIETALPAASMALVTAVALPFLPHGPGGDAGAPRASRVARPPAVAGLAGAPGVTVAGVVPAVARPVAAAPRATGVTYRAERPAPRPEPTQSPMNIDVGKGDKKVRLASDEDGKILTEDDMRACRTEGPSVRTQPAGYVGPFRQYELHVGCGD